MNSYLLFEGEAEDVVRRHSCYSEKRVWRRPREVRDIWHHGGEKPFKFTTIFTTCLRFNGDLFLALLLQEDVCLQGYQHYVSSCSGPAPLTLAEQELQRIKITEVRSQLCVHRASLFYCP